MITNKYNRDPETLLRNAIEAESHIKLLEPE